MSGPTPSATPSEMTISDELLAPVTSDVELCYQTFGDPDAEPLLLVMGLGGPMTWWDPELCRALARAEDRQHRGEPEHPQCAGKGGQAQDSRDQHGPARRRPAERPCEEHMPKV